MGRALDPAVKLPPVRSPVTLASPLKFRLPITPGTRESEQRVRSQHWCPVFARSTRARGPLATVLATVLATGSLVTLGEHLMLALSPRTVSEHLGSKRAHCDANKGAENRSDAFHVTSIPYVSVWKASLSFHDRHCKCCCRRPPVFVRAPTTLNPTMGHPLVRGLLRPAPCSSHSTEVNQRSGEGRGERKTRGRRVPAGGGGGGGGADD